MKIQISVLVGVIAMIFYLIWKWSSSDTIIYFPLEPMKMRYTTAADILNRQTQRIIKESNELGTHAYPTYSPELFRAPSYVVERIPAFHKFTPQYLTKNIQNLVGVYTHEKKVFVHYNEKRPLTTEMKLAHEKLKNSPGYNQDQDLSLFHTMHDEHMDPYHFFKHLQYENDAKEKVLYHYLSQSVQLLGKTITNDVVPYIEDLKVTDTEMAINLWIGGRGSTAQTHYDANHNMYLQLKGQKKFKLYEPSAWKNLYLYPRLHPCDRQSQINFESVDPVRFPNLQKINQVSERGPYEVTLGPGDLLYIPPFWFHHVEAVGTDISISINVFTDCIEHTRHYRMSNISSPFDDGLPSDTKRAHVITLTRLIVEKLLFKTKTKDGQSGISDYPTTSEYVRKVVTSRYEPLFIAGYLPSKTDCKIPDVRVSDAMEIYANEVVAVAMTISPSIRPIIVGHFIEELLNRAIEAKLVGAVLNSCF